jgi:tetratricopeptide (TPR) repeat protein
VEADRTGRFQVQGLPAGEYTISVLVPDRGRMQTSIEIGAAHADQQGRVSATFQIREADLVPNAGARRVVSVKALAIPGKARDEYRKALQELGRNRSEQAQAHLLRALEIAPAFAAAWNDLGAIAYRADDYTRAEECFREALAADPALFEARVNLGGVLLTRHKVAEAVEANVKAVKLRSNDALANSQLGLTYFEAGQMDLSEQYLERARSLDPAHFSHPQLALAAIHERQQNPQQAARDLEDFLKYHPDWPNAALIRRRIGELRNPAQ